MVLPTHLCLVLPYLPVPQSVIHAEPIRYLTPLQDRHPLAVLSEQVLQLLSQARHLPADRYFPVGHAVQVVVVPEQAAQVLSQAIYQNQYH